MGSEGVGLNPGARRFIEELAKLNPSAAALRLGARLYLDLQQERQAHTLRSHLLEAVEATLKVEEPVVSSVKGLFEQVLEAYREHERRLLDEMWGLVKEVYPSMASWCERVKGLGKGAALIFAGYINPYIATTAGRAKAYCGLKPGAVRRAGVFADYNPEVKSRVWLAARNVIMKRDDWYRPLFDAKKHYYLHVSPYSRIFDSRGNVVDPKACPQYEDCYKRMAGAAQRKMREEIRWPCRAHIHMMSLRWLAELLVSHAAQLMREDLDLDVSAYKAHQPYIPPKPTEPSTGLLSRLCEQVSKGLR